MSTSIITITNIPNADIEAQVMAIANAAKSSTWHSGACMQPDHVFIRAALAVIHLAELGGHASRSPASQAPMSDASMLAALLAASFHVVEDEPPRRAQLLAARLRDPSQEIADAVEVNRRLLGLDQGTRKRLLLDPDLTDGQHPTVHDRPDAGLLQLMSTWMQDAQAGDEITIGVVEMSDAEADSLPEV